MSNMPNAFEEEIEKSQIVEDALSEIQLASLDKEQEQTVQAAQAPPKVNVKPKLMTAAAFVKQAEETDKFLRENLSEKVNFDPRLAAQVLPKSKLPIKQDRVIDFSNITEQDIYNESIPLEAKPFGAEDSLRIDLKDKNYAARWVNVHPRMLGQALKNGFSYITNADLETPLELALGEDVNGHFKNHDVVAMKCPKSIYFAALKASHMRAMNTLSSLSAQKAAKKKAFDLMSEGTSGAFAEAYEQGKVSFYNPGIEI